MRKKLYEERYLPKHYEILDLVREKFKFKLTKKPGKYGQSIVLGQVIPWILKKFDGCSMGHSSLGYWADLGPTVKHGSISYGHKTLTGALLKVLKKATS